MTDDLTNPVPPQPPVPVTQQHVLSNTDPYQWLDMRWRDLGATAKETRACVDGTKVLGAGTVVLVGGGALLMSASGVGLLALFGGGATYLGSIIYDLIDTGEFAPIPFMRSNLFERFDRMGDASKREMYKQFVQAKTAAGCSVLDEWHELYSYLTKEESLEATMLLTFRQYVGWLLAQVPVAQRDTAYSFICGEYLKFRDNLTGLTIERVTDYLEGRVNGNFMLMKPAEVHDYGTNVIGTARAVTVQEIQDDAIALPGSEPQAQPALPGAISVEATTVLPSIDLASTPAETVRRVATATTDTVTTENNIQALDLRAVIAGRELLDSIIWIGPSQSGKTTTCDQVVRGLKKRFGKNMTIYYMSPFTRKEGDNDEQRLFDYADRTLRADLLNCQDPMIITAAYLDFCEFIDEWINLPHSKVSPKLFICDEISIHAGFAQDDKIGTTVIKKGNAAAGQFFGKYSTVINMNASGGKAEGVAVYGLAPTGFVGGLGLNQSTLGAISSVYISSTTKWLDTVYKGAAKNDLACKPAPTKDELKAWDAKGVKRVVSVDADHWIPLAVYTIPRSSTPDPEATPEPDWDTELEAEATEVTETPDTTPVVDAKNRPTDTNADLSELAQKLYTWLTTGAGTKYHQTSNADGYMMTIVLKENVINNGSRHRVGGKVTNFDGWALGDAVGELVSAKLINKTPDGNIIISKTNI